MGQPRVSIDGHRREKPAVNSIRCGPVSGTVIDQGNSDLQPVFPVTYSHSYLGKIRFETRMATAFTERFKFTVQQTILVKPLYQLSFVEIKSLNQLVSAFALRKTARVVPHSVLPWWIKHHEFCFPGRWLSMNRNAR